MVGNPDVDRRAERQRQDAYTVGEVGGGDHLGGTIERLGSRRLRRPYDEDLVVYHGPSVGVGAVLGFLASHGITVSEADSAGLTAACIAIATAAYYAAARAAEASRFPWLANVGRFLLGGVARTPVTCPASRIRTATATNRRDSTRPARASKEDGRGVVFVLAPTVGGEVNPDAMHIQDFLGMWHQGARRVPERVPCNRRELLWFGHVGDAAPFMGCESESHLWSTARDAVVADTRKANMIRKDRHGGFLLQLAKGRMHRVFLVPDVPAGQIPMTWKECVTSLDQEDVRPPQQKHANIYQSALPTVHTFTSSDLSMRSSSPSVTDSMCTRLVSCADDRARLVRSFSASARP